MASPVDHGLVKRLRQEVGDRLAEQRRADQASRPAADDRRGRAPVRARPGGPGPRGPRTGRDHLRAHSSQRHGGGGARGRRARRALRRRPSAAAARRSRDREHRHQRLRPGVPRLRRRPGGRGRAGRRQRRGAHRAHPGARCLLRPVLAALRHREPAAGPAPARRFAALGGHGRHPAPRPVDPPCAPGQGVPARSGEQRHGAAGARRLPAGCRHGAQEHHDRRVHQRREDHAAARARQRDPRPRAADHRGARAGAGPGPVPRAAPERGRVRGAAAELRGPRRGVDGRAGAPAACA